MRRKFLLKVMILSLLFVALGGVDLFAQTNLYVSSDYNSSTEGFGSTKFSNYAGAYAYATANAKNATIVIEKTNTLSGNCFDNNHKNYSNLKVVIKDGAAMGVASSKWDMTYPVTVEPGASLVSARPANASYINSHIKNTLTIGSEGATKKATLDFLSGSYKEGSIAVLYNGKIVANNADIKIGDLGFTGNATFNNCNIEVDGVLATGKNNFYKQSMTNTQVEITGTNYMNENTYYSTVGTTLNNLTLTNSSIIIDDSNDKTPEPVTIKKLTLEASDVKVYDNADVTISGTVIADGDSALETENIKLDSNGKVMIDGVEATIEDNVLYYPVADFNALKAAVEAGKGVKLTADITATGAVDGTDANIDLNDKTLKLNVGDNNFFGDSKVKNGYIDITGCVASGDCIIGIGDYSNSATLTFDNVNVTGDGYSSAYAVLYVYNSSELNINGGSVVVSNDNASLGGVIKAHKAADGIINIVGTEGNPVELTFNNAKIGMLDGTVLMNYVDLDITGGANAINQSALTIKNSTLDITGADGRALTLSQGDVVVENSTLNFSDCSEGEIRFKKSLELTADINSTINTCTTYADASATEAKINGVDVDASESSMAFVTVENGTTTVKEAPKGNNFTGYTGEDRIWGEVWGNASESFVIKVLDANGNVMGTTSLNNVDGIIDGDVTVTWSIYLDIPESNGSGYWTMEWTAAPNINNMPAKVELWVDGVKVSGGNVVLNAPDNLNPIYAAVTDADGEILSYHTSIANAVAAITNTRSNPQGYIALLRDTNEEVTLPAGITLNLNGHEAPNVSLAPVASVNGTTYTDLQEAIKAAAPAGTVEILSDVIVDKWIMFSETLDISSGQIITMNIDGLTINGNGKTVTINSIESASNGNRLFYDATKLNINNWTINYANGVAGGIGLTSGNISNVTFIGGTYGVFPGAGNVTVTGCTFNTNGTAIYFEQERDHLVVTNNTFELPADANVILLRGDVKFTGNTVVSGRTVNVVSGSPEVTGNDFNDVRFKVYNAAEATIKDNKINVLAFNDESVVYSTFTTNTLSDDAQEVLDAASFMIKVSTKAKLDAAINAANDGDVIEMTADIDYGTDQLAIAKAITLDLGGKTLTTRNAYGGMSIKNNPTIKNGNIVHASNTAAIKVWNATAFENLVIDVQGKGDANKTIGGIVLQSGTTTRVGSIKNVTIKGDALTNGIETYNCGDATDKVIGSMEYVNIDAVGTAMLISAPCGTATNCTFDGGVNGIEIWIKGNYSASLGLVDCEVVGGVFAHDEFSSNPEIVNNGTLNLTADEATTGAGVDDVTLTLARVEAESVDGVLEDVMEQAKAKVNNTYYQTLAEAVAAAQDKDVIEIIKEGNYTLPEFAGKELTFKGTYKVGTSITDWVNKASQGMMGSTVHFESLTISGQTENYYGLFHTNAVTYKDCNINGLRFLYSPTTFTNCAFNADGVEHSFWTYGASNVTVTGCTFTYKDRAVNCYSEAGANHELDIIFTDCTFTYKGSADAPEGAVEINSSSVKSIDLVMNECTAPEKGEMWFNSQWDLKHGANTVVKVDGVVVWTAPVKIGETKYGTLQAAIDAVQNGETITLLSDITENVTLTEKVGLYYTIDGSDKTMNGSITVNPLSDTNDNRRITISNINFVENTDANVDFISAVNTNHYPRLTISGCEFTGSGNDGDVAIRLKSSHSVVIEDCTGTGLHSFLQNTSGWNLTINNVTVTESKGGLALGTVQGVTVEECNVTTDTYGIRLDADTYNNNAVIESCTVKAFIPVVVRKVNTESTITFEGTNTMTQTNTDGLWCAIGKGEYENNGEMPEAPATGKVTVTLNDTGLNAEGIYGNYAPIKLKDANNKVVAFHTNFEDALAAAIADENVVRMEISEDVTQTTVKNSDDYYDVVRPLSIGTAGAEVTVSIKPTSGGTISVRVMGDDASLIIEENLTIDHLDVVANGFATTGESMVINGTLKAVSLKQWTNNNTITVSETGSVWLGFGDGQFDMAYGNGTVTINGNGNETEPQFKAGYSGTRGNGNTLNLNDTYFEGGAWFNVNGSNGVFNINESVLKVSGGDGAGSLTVASSGNKFNLTNGAKLDVATLTLGTGNNITIDGTSQVVVTTLSGEGTINIDATNLTEDSKPIVGNASSFAGEIKVINNDDLKVIIDENGNVSIVEKVYVAQIGEDKYESFQDALNAGGNVTVLRDIALAEGVTVAADKTVVLDLNGKEISRNTEAATSTAAITNNGNLTIKDSSDSSTGKITAFAANPDTQALPYYASNTITNCGVLTVLGGTIENSTGDEARAAFPIDNNSTSRDAIVTIKGGKVTGRGAIRQFANSTTHKNEVNVKGGEVFGSSYAIWVQNPNSNDNKAALNIEDGTLSKILISPSANFEVAISGGTLTEVAIWNADETNTERNPSNFISGGTFSSDVSEFCAEGFKVEQNADGTYGVVPFVEKSYEIKENTTLADAIAQANNDGADIVTYTIYGAATLETGGSHGIVDFGGREGYITIKGGSGNTRSTDSFTITGGGVPDIKGVTFKDLTFYDEGTYLPTANEFMYQNFIDCTFENVTFEDGIRLSGNSVVRNCTFNANTNNEYAIWLDEGTFEMTGSTVTAGNDAYGLLKSDEVDKITISDNTFQYLAKVNKEALNVKNAIIVAEDNTFIDCAKGVVPTDKTNYTEDGETIITNEIIAVNNTVVVYVAKINDTKYQSLAEAATAAQDGETIELLWAEGHAPISMAATIVNNKTVTITGTADVDWDKDWLYVGRNGEGNGKLIFNEAKLTSKSVGTGTNGTGLNVSCKKVGESTTNDGEVEIIDSNIQLDYLIGKGNIKLDNSTLEVYEGFAVGARPASETGGVQRTVTMDITKGSNVIVDNHNGQGLGHESNGIMNIDATSTFETQRSFLITANGTMNNAGTVAINGTLTNNGTINLTDVALTGMTIDGTGTTYFYNTVNFYGNNNITTNINGTPFELIVNEDATLLISRFVLGYNRAITVYGNIEDAHNLPAEQIASMTPSLKFNSTSGVSVGGTATGRLTAKDAYLEFGSSSWKNSQAEHTWSFENCYVSATSFGNNNEPGAVTSTWNVTFDNSVLAAKNFIKNGVGVSYNFTNGSVATTGSMRIDGELNVDATSSVTTTAQQNNVAGGLDEHGGVNGTINIDGTLTIGSTSKTQLEVLGGEVNVTETGNIILLENTLTLDAASKMRSCGNITGAITAAEGADVEITGGTYTQDVNEWCHEYYDAIPNGDGTWTVEQVMYAQTTELQAGWNWYSSYINLASDEELVEMQNAFDGKGLEIKGKTGFSDYQYIGNDENGVAQYKWYKTEDFSISAKQMYMIKTTEALDLVVDGKVVNPAANPISLRFGWNWIGYPMTENVAINVALANATDGDIIKARNGQATYSTNINPETNEIFGWVGTLTTLTPGQGYKYQSNANRVLVYSYGDRGSKYEDENITFEDNYWVPAVSEYANNMTITAMLSIDSEIVKENYEIAAFANGECRGSARPIYVEGLDSYMLYMTIYGEGVEELTFKYYDVNYGTEYELSDRINYSDDAIVGSFNEPYMFNLDILNIEESSVEDINIYPNPTTTSSEINLQAMCDKVEVFNALGVKVAEYTNVDSIDALETAGIYVIRVTIDGNARNCRLVVK